jgi:hypothetical protein
VWRKREQRSVSMGWASGWGSLRQLQQRHRRHGEWDGLLARTQRLNTATVGRLARHRDAARQRSGATDEGAALAELIHDLAPGAGIMFDYGAGGEAAFAQAIEALRQCGADVMVDDLVPPRPDVPGRSGCASRAAGGR